MNKPKTVILKEIHIPAYICMTFGVLEINTGKEDRSALWSC